MPIEKTESNALTRGGNTALFAGTALALGSTITALSGGPDGIPTGTAFVGGVVLGVAGAIALTIGNGPKGKGDTGRVPSGHLEGFSKIRMAQRLGRPLSEAEKEEIAKRYGND